MKNRFELVRPVVLLILVSIIAVGSLQGQSSAQASAAHLFGIVKDSNGSAIPGARLVFEGEGGAKEIHTDEEGAYYIDLPSGLYRAKADARWFCSVKRPAFKAQPEKSTWLDFFLDVCPIVNSLIVENGRYKGETDEPTPPFKMEVISIKRLAPFELLIYFGQRTEYKDRGLIRYDRIKTIDGRFLPVTFMYDLLTVKADKVTFDKKNRNLMAEGNVMIYNNEQVDLGVNAEIKFNKGSPTITVKR